MLLEERIDLLGELANVATQLGVFLSALLVEAFDALPYLELIVFVDSDCHVFVLHSVTFPLFLCPKHQ